MVTQLLETQQKVDAKQLDRFARKHLGHFPTPLERLGRLTDALGGPEIWIKRDDCTGLSTGGNKARKLEYLMAEADAQGADVIMTVGAFQSNCARQTAACAAKLGLECHIVLANPSGNKHAAYHQSGNLLLDRLHGATIEVSQSGDRYGDMAAAAAHYAKRGKKVYTIPAGGSTAIGSLGYVRCASELLSQLAYHDMKVDRIVHATGSGGTQAGLLTGLKLMDAGIALTGISVGKPQKKQQELVFGLACETANLLGYSGLITLEDVAVNADYIGEQYGVPTKAGLEAIDLFARLEGILLDPVYSGKGAAGLIDQIRQGHYGKDERIVFLHTGGSAALFGYFEEFENPA